MKFALSGKAKDVFRQLNNMAFWEQRGIGKMHEIDMEQRVAWHFLDGNLCHPCIARSAIISKEPGYRPHGN